MGGGGGERGERKRFERQCLTAFRTTILVIYYGAATTLSKSIDFFPFPKITGEISHEGGEISPLFFCAPDLRRIT